MLKKERGELHEKSCTLKKEKLKIIDSRKATADTFSDHKLLKDIKVVKISRVGNKVKRV